MAKHNMFRKELPTAPDKLPLHPIWRGIGCIMAVVLPVVSFIVSTLLFENQEQFKWMIVPQELMLKNNPKDPLLLAKLVYAAIILFIIAAILAIITFFVNKLLGPSKYGPYDVPPERVQKR